MANCHFSSEKKKIEKPREPSSVKKRDRERERREREREIETEEEREIEKGREKDGKTEIEEHKEKHSIIWSIRFAANFDLGNPSNSKS